MKRFVLFVTAICLFIGLESSIEKLDHHEKYALLVNNHPYSTREPLTPEQLKAIPKKDRPDLAMEQDYLLTMDPALGRPAPERLLSVYQQVSQARKNPIPGTPGGTNNPWVERGPSNVGGRTRAIMYDPNDANHKKVWAGGVTGGLWYNNDITNPSSQWVAVNDFWDNIAITAIAADPTNSNIFYVGTGEGWGASSSRGAGIWKSIDGGNNWTQLAASSNFYFVNDLIVRNENGTGVVYAALQGMSYSGNTHGISDEGLQRSADGGQTFSQVMPNIPGRSHPFPIADIEIGANNRIWVGTAVSYRSINPKGGGSILSSDDGINWTTSYSRNNGERVEIACAPSDSNYVYAIVEKSNKVDEIIKTTNHGQTWSNVSEPNDVDNGIPSTDFSRNQAWYDLILAVDPNNANTVFAGAIDLFKTTNGGSSWNQLSHWYGGYGYPEVHADQHAIVFKPGSSSEALFGNDGGVYRSTNLTSFGPSFSNVNKGYNVTQFYACAIHPNSGSNHFLAGTQDNGSQKFTSTGINNTQEVTGGDGGYCFIDQTNPQIQVTSYVYNSFWRSTNGGASFNSRIQNEQTGSFINPADYDNNLHILYSGRNGVSINRILNMNGSPNVDPFTAYIGGMTTHLRVSPYTTTSTTLFVGTSAGRVFKITNADGASPTTTNLTTPSLPAGSVSCIEIGANEDELLVTYSNYGITSVWYTNDGGTTWASKEGNLPDMPIRWALFNPNNRSEALLATEVGVWRCSNIHSPNPSWTPSTSGLANVRTSMLQMRNSDNEVIAATYGRGLFSSSAFSSVQKPTASFSASANPVCGTDPVFLFDQSTSAPSSWEWIITPNTFSFTNGTSANSTNPQIDFHTSGTYQVKLVTTNSSGKDSTTNSISVNIFSSPVISALGNQLYCSSTEPGLTYKWYENGNLIQGAGGPVINITSNATYSVEVSMGGCSMTSPDFVLQNVGLEQFETTEGVKLFPNPAKDMFWVELNNPSAESGLIRIMSMQGKTLHEESLSSDDVIRQQIDISELPAGFYIVSITLGNKNFTHKMEKL